MPISPRAVVARAVLALCTTAACAVSIGAQRQQAQPSAPASPTPIALLTPTPPAPDNLDLSIKANVTARELQFEVVPNPTVEFTGQPRRDTV